MLTFLFILVSALREQFLASRHDKVMIVIQILMTQIKKIY